MKRRPRTVLENCGIAAAFAFAGRSDCALQNGMTGRAVEAFAAALTPFTKQKNEYPHLAK